MRGLDIRGFVMKVDLARLKGYVLEITKSSSDLKLLVDQHDLKPDSVPLKAAKYLLIELAEAMSNVLQHLLARERGVAVSGYIDGIVKAKEYGLISDGLFEKLKPFFDFRNSLVHRYWVIDDSRLIQNIVNGRADFDQFLDEIESYLRQMEKEKREGDEKQR
jgi:uncharacterized protein YutE (UPF0331/DUF86 family)